MKASSWLIGVTSLFIAIPITFAWAEDSNTIQPLFLAGPEAKQKYDELVTDHNNRQDGQTAASDAGQLAQSLFEGHEEEILQNQLTKTVPYRFNRVFSGNIICEESETLIVGPEISMDQMIRTENASAQVLVHSTGVDPGFEAVKDRLLRQDVMAVLITRYTCADITLLASPAAKE